MPWGRHGVPLGCLMWVTLICLFLYIICCRDDFGKPTPLFIRICVVFRVALLYVFISLRIQNGTLGTPERSPEKLEKGGFSLFGPHVMNPHVLTCPVNSESGARSLFGNVIWDTLGPFFGRKAQELFFGAN